MRIFNFIKDILFPKECLSCNLEGAWLCPACLKKIKFSAGETVHNPDLILDDIWIAGNYEDKILATLIKKFKYNFLKEIGEILGKFLSAFLQTKILANSFLFFDKKTDNYLLIPVPLSKKRKKWRGFNQAEVLARVIANIFNFKMSLKLSRNKNTRPQAELSETERKVNLSGSFIWTGQDLSDYQVILIDDVTTTGSTLNECARALKLYNPQKIFGLVVAKG